MKVKLSPKVYYFEPIISNNKINTQIIKDITNKYEEKIKYLNIDKNESINVLL